MATEIRTAVVTHRGNIILGDEPLFYVKEDKLDVVEDFLLTHYILLDRELVADTDYGKRLFDIMVKDDYQPDNSGEKPFLYVTEYHKSISDTKRTNRGLSIEVNGSVRHLQSLNWYKKYKINSNHLAAAKLNKKMIKAELAKYSGFTDNGIETLVKLMRYKKYGSYAEMLWRLNCVIDLYESGNTTVAEVLAGAELC